MTDPNHNLLWPKELIPRTFHNCKRPVRTEMASFLIVLATFLRKKKSSSVSEKTFFLLKRR